MAYAQGNLDALEAEAIHTIREVAASFENPVLLYSIGKDSMCMLHAARKAFAPAPLPFPLLHIDTTWNFREMIEFRDRYCEEHGLRLVVHVNRDAIDAGMNPFDHPSSIYTPTMNTHALIEALTFHSFDAALGGGREAALHEDVGPDHLLRRRRPEDRRAGDLRHAVGVALPSTALGISLGFTPLPRLYWPLLACSLVGYVILTQAVKTWLVRKGWI